MRRQRCIGADGWLPYDRLKWRGRQGLLPPSLARKKDMILVSGFNVYPNEIEDVVAQCPGVLEVAAVGVPDEKSGEAVKIVVVRKDPALTAETLKEHCRANLTGYKLPKYIEFRDSLPKTNVGKILRRELRDQSGQNGRTVSQHLPVAVRLRSTRPDRRSCRAGSTEELPCRPGYARRRNRQCQSVMRATVASRWMFNSGPISISST